VRVFLLSIVRISRLDEMMNFSLECSNSREVCHFPSCRYNALTAATTRCFERIRSRQRNTTLKLVRGDQRLNVDFIITQFYTQIIASKLRFAIARVSRICYIHPVFSPVSSFPFSLLFFPPHFAFISRGSDGRNFHKFNYQYAAIAD